MYIPHLVTDITLPQHNNLHVFIIKGNKEAVQYVRTCENIVEKQVFTRHQLWRTDKGKRII